MRGEEGTARRQKGFKTDWEVLVLFIVDTREPIAFALYC